MIDLSSPNAFKDEMYDLKKYVNNRILTSDKVDAKNKEIDDWIAEQEAKKNQTAVDMNIDDWTNPQELQQQQDFSNMQNSFMSAQTDDYEDLVKTIRQSMQPHRKNNLSSNNASFGMNSNIGMNDYVENVTPALYWVKMASWGRLLNSYEDKDLDDKNKEQINNGFSFGANAPNNANEESKEDKATRLMIEDWRPTLFAGKISLLLVVLSAVMFALSIHPLWANPLVLLVMSLLAFGYFTFQLNHKFNDGPLKSNFLFNELALQRYVHQQEVEKQKKEAAEKNNNQPQGLGQGGMPNFSNDFGDDDFSDVDFEDEDDDIEETNSNAISVPDNNKINVTKPKADDDVAENNFPKAWGAADDKEELYHVEERFLKYCYEQRGKIKLNKPVDILRFFAPIIVSYNKSFAKASILDKQGWVFKNIAYALGKYYNELDTKFAKYGKHDKEYYYVIDDIEATALFYKVKITLPISVKSDQFKSNLDKFINILKTDPNDDAVDVLLEMAGRSGYVKIMRLNKKGFMPTVSTGDVLRFENMKTTTGADLIEELSKPGDLKVFFGLQNAEHALVFDIGGHQNTNMAVDGFTGSGKTVTTTAWFDNILVSHSPDEVGFLILDPKKGSAWQAFRYAPHVLGYFATEDMKKWPAITEMLRQIESARQDYMNNTVRMENYYEARKAFASKQDWEQLMKVPRLIVIYDEMIDTLSTLTNFDAEAKTENKMIKSREDKKFAVYKDSFKTSLGGLANVTREGGMTLIALSQRSDDNSMPRTFLSSASIQFGMRTKYPQDISRLFSIDDKDVPKNITSLPVGSGYLAANGLPLSQLSTPLFSGDPKLNSEITKIVGLAWTILYSYDHDETKAPEGYFFEKAKQKDVYGLPKFSLFNRDKMFERIKRELKNGDIHYAKVHSDLSFDLDKKDNNVIETQQVNNDDNSLSFEPQQPVQKSFTTTKMVQPQVSQATVQAQAPQGTMQSDGQTTIEQEPTMQPPVMHTQLKHVVSAQTMQEPVEAQPQTTRPLQQREVNELNPQATQPPLFDPTAQDKTEQEANKQAEDAIIEQYMAQQEQEEQQVQTKTTNQAMFSEQPVPQPTITTPSETMFAQPKPQPTVAPAQTNNMFTPQAPITYKNVLAYFDRNHINRIDCATLEHFYSIDVINAAINTQHLVKQGNFYIVRKNVF